MPSDELSNTRQANSDESAELNYRKITKASIKYDSPIFLRLGKDKSLEFRREGDDYFLLEPSIAVAGKLDTCDGAVPLLNGAHLVVGRQEISTECLHLPESISRQHLLIKREFDMIYLFDLHSKNYTFLSHTP